MMRASRIWDVGARALIERVTLQVCEHNAWTLLGANARTNPLHLVVSAGCAP